MRIKVDFRAFARVATFAAATASSATMAQSSGPRNGQAYGDWRLACVARAINDTECLIRQVVIRPENRSLLGEITLSRRTTDDGDKVLLMAKTPAGMALPVKPAYRIDEAGEQLPLDWQTCAGRFCTATRFLEPSEVDALRYGGQMIFGYQVFGTPSPVAFTVSLRGVTEGLDALSQTP